MSLYVGLVIWNRLLFPVRHAQTVLNFKSQLKTHLFSVSSKVHWDCEYIIWILEECCCHSSGAVWELRWPSWAVRPNEPSGFRGCKSYIKPCFGTGLSLSLLCQLTSEDIKQHYLLTYLARFTDKPLDPWHRPETLQVVTSQLFNLRVFTFWFDTEKALFQVILSLL